MGIEDLMSLLESNRPWRHRALAPLVLTEATKSIYVAKWTEKRVTLYVPHPSDPDKVKKVAVAHKNVGKYAYKTVDPPPGEKPIGYIPDPWKYKGPSDIYPIDVPKAPAASPAPAKQAKFIPVYDWSDKSVWVWVKKSGGQPILTEIPHKKVQGYAKRLGWATQKLKLVGKIDPTTYSSPEDIYPLDWDPGDETPDFVPTAAHAISMEFVPEYDDEVTTPSAAPEEVVLKPVVDPNVPKLNIHAEFETLTKKDFNGLPLVKHKGSGQTYSVLPDGTLALLDVTIGKYLPIKKTSGGWDFDHDAALLSPKSLKKSSTTKVSGPKPDPKMGLKVDGEDANGLPAYKITKTDPFPPGVQSPVVWLPTKEWGYLDGNTYQTLEWEDGEWWEGDEEYSASAMSKAKNSSAVPEGFKLPGVDYTIKTVTKKHVIVTTPEGESVKWVQAVDAWYYMDEPWKEWTPPGLAATPAPEGEGPPEGAPDAPPGFEISSGPNKHGAWPLTTSEYDNDGNWFLLPDGKLGKYDDYKGAYETYTYGTKGWVLDTTLALPSAAVKMQKYYSSPLPVPEEYQLSGYDLNGLPQVNKGPATKLFTLLPNGMIAVWSSSKDSYKTQVGTLLTLDQILTGDFGPILSVPKTELADTPEEAPFATKFIDSLDSNGYPMVNEVDPDDPESPYVTKGLTLLPDESVAMWSKSGHYTKYKWDTDEGYVSTYHSTPAQDVDRLLAALSLAVKGFRYHKVIQIGDEETVAAGGPPGFELLTPSEDQKGLIPAKHLETGTLPFFLLPGDRAAGPTTGDLWMLYQVGAGGKLTTLNKSLTIEMIRAMTQGYDPEPPIHSKFAKGAKAFDLHGYPRVVDEDGEKLTLLPNGEVAKWSKGMKQYEVWTYDYGFGGYYPRHPERAYTLKQVEKLKLKKLKTFKSVSPTKVPEPSAAPPSTAVTAKEQKGVPIATGMTDLNGYMLYKYKLSSFSGIPISTGYGKWLPSAVAYAIVDYEVSQDKFAAQMAGSKQVFWYKGDVEVSVGKKEAEAGLPMWSIVPHHTTDDQGLPTVQLLKNGKVFDFFSQLPTGDLGKWSEANSAYVVHKIDKDPSPPGAIPVYGTIELYKPGSQVGGYTYPFSVKWKLPKEWSPSSDLSTSEGKIVIGDWTYPEGIMEAGLRASGEIYVVKFGPSVKHIPVWNPEDGYLNTPYSYGPYSKQPASDLTPTGPDPKKVAKDAAAAAKPSDKSTSQLIADLAGKLPDIDALVHKGSGNHLGGAGQKDIFEDPTTGMKFIFKPALPKSGSKVEPFRAHAQEAFAALALKVRPDHVPIKTVTYKGKLGTLQPMLELDAEQSDLKKAGGMKPEELTTQQQEDVSTEHMLSWLMSQHDDHRGNLLKTKDGRILSVDKEQGWKYFDFDKLDVDFNPNSKYGEEEPFYNKFWRSFSEGTIDFDPMVMMPALMRIESMESAGYLSTLQGYVQASFPGDDVKQHRFRQKALKRKLHLRRDFEVFIHALYEKREGKKGTFTFDEGWIADDEVKGKKFKKIKFQAKQLAAEQGLADKPFKYVGPDGQTLISDEKVTLKVPKAYPESKLFDFLNDLGLKPIPFPNGESFLEGQQYKMVSVDKQKFDQAVIEKEVPITEAFVSTPVKPRYWPELPEAKQMQPTLEKDLQKFDEIRTGREGHAMLSDGGKVEGQAAKAKRFQDPKGDYLLFTFKLRPGAWGKIKSSSKTKSGKLTWYVSNYDPTTDVFVENRDFPAYKTTQGIMMYGGEIHSTPGVEWGYKGSDCFVATSSSDYAYKGQVTLKLRGVSGSGVSEAAKAALNYAVAGLGDEIFRDPTPEDREIMKMMRLLWAKNPATADALPESSRTVPKLKALLKSKKISMSDLGKVEEQEVFKGYHSHVLPGRWKKMPEVAYLFNGIRTLPAAVSICKSGLMGIQERNTTGIQQFGGSYTADVSSGSGDGILCRVVTKSAFSYSLSNSNFSGQYQAIVHPDALDRLDSYMYDSDTFGKCRKDYSGWSNRTSVETQVERQSDDWTSGNEISFRKGMHLDKILRICTSSETLRKGLINSLRGEKIEKVNGIPVEDFVVVAQKHGDVYNRYVKPLLPSASI